MDYCEVRLYKGRKQLLIIDCTYIALALRTNACFDSGTL